MNFEEIFAVLTSVTSKDGPQLKAASREREGVDAEHAQASLIHALAAPVEEVLARQEEFRCQPMLMLNEGMSSWSFSARMVAPILLKQTLESGSATEAVGWLREVLANKAVRVACVMVLRGVLPTGKIEFKDGIQLIPFGELPESAQKLALIEAKYPRPASIVRAAHSFEDPPAALIATVSIGPPLVKHEETPPPDDNPCLQAFNRMDDVRLALTAVGPCSPWDEVRWVSFENVLLERGRRAFGTMFRHMEIQPFIQEHLTELDALEAKAAVDGFAALHGTVRSKVSIALDRLNRSMLRTSPGDRALELAIALESLLSSKGEREGEHTYKIGLRSALLSDGHLEQRCRVRAIVRAIYSMRSRLVHDGTTNDIVDVAGQGQRPAKDVVIEGARVCAALIRKVITGGRLPDWTTLEVTGA